jgi:hypothetical protein
LSDDSSEGLSSSRLLSLQQLLQTQLVAFVDALDTAALGYGQYARSRIGAQIVVIMPFVFVKLNGHALPGSYWDTEQYGSPEWACDILGEGGVAPASSLEERMSRLYRVGLEEVLLVDMDKRGIQIWRREANSLAPLGAVGSAFR